MNRNKFIKGKFQITINHYIDISVIDDVMNFDIKLLIKKESILKIFNELYIDLYKNIYKYLHDLIYQRYKYFEMYNSSLDLKYIKQYEDVIKLINKYDVVNEFDYYYNKFFDNITFEDKQYNLITNLILEWTIKNKNIDESRKIIIDNIFNKIYGEMKRNIEIIIGIGIEPIIDNYFNEAKNKIEENIIIKMGEYE